mmetsp:Transcript_9602/g.22070  ORF Transcript_9602/g.22070 Transcript_9602/m.22070 type:complete len:209 (+) Transcript_9602:358-984(+)
MFLVTLNGSTTKEPRTCMNHTTHSRRTKSHHRIHLMVTRDKTIVDNGPVRKQKILQIVRHIAKEQQTSPNSRTKQLKQLPKEGRSPKQEPKPPISTKPLICCKSVQQWDVDGCASQGVHNPLEHSQEACPYHALQQDANQYSTHNLKERIHWQNSDHLIQWNECPHERNHFDQVKDVTCQPLPKWIRLRFRWTIIIHAFLHLCQWSNN